MSHVASGAARPRSATRRSDERDRAEQTDLGRFGEQGVDGEIVVDGW